MYTVTLEDKPVMRLAAIEHRGAYSEISQTYEKLMVLMSSRNLWPRVIGAAALYYDDPSKVAAAELRSHAGFVVGPDLSLPDDIKEVVVPAGEYAVLMLEGPYTGLLVAYDYLYGDWMQTSGREAASNTSIEVYLNTPKEVAPRDLRTEVWVPLKPT